MLRASSRLFGKALVVAEYLDGKIVPASLAAITAATKVGPVSALVAAKDAKSLGAELAKVSGVAEVLVATGDQYAAGLPEQVAPLVKSIVDKHNFTHVFAATSAFGKNVIPRAAAKSDSMPITDITAIESEDTFVRQMYAGNAVTTVKSSDKIKFITVRGTSFERAAVTGGSASVVEAEASAAVSSAKWVEDLIAKSDKPELTTAAKVVAGGRGLKNGDNFKLLYDLAEPLKAAVGATRAVVDAGYVPNDMQIGQTGKTIAPQLYIGAGISGAIQHVAGMKESKVIAVINTDADAPFFQVADYGLVADLFEAVPTLTKLVKS
jgi:electron transfer flavoprotein alpha subunit